VLGTTRQRYASLYCTGTASEVIEYFKARVINKELSRQNKAIENYSKRVK
jgi:hypothetical protein